MNTSSVHEPPADNASPTPGSRGKRAVARDLLASARCWRSWVTVRDYREATEDAGKLADKFDRIRELTLFRWRVTGAVTGAAALAGTLAGSSTALVRSGSPVPRHPWHWPILGHRKDGNPGRKPALAGARAFAWTMDPQVLVTAFRDAKLIGKDESLRLVEGVRGKGGHAGRVSLWVADEDPYATPPLRTPLLNADSRDAWRPVPFGRDARDRRIDLPLVWTSLLVGAVPRQGKTFATRLATAGLILDAHTRCRDRARPSYPATRLQNHPLQATRRPRVPFRAAGGGERE